MQEKRAHVPYLMRVLNNFTRALPAMNLASKISLLFMFILAIFIIKFQSNYFSVVEGRDTLERDMQAFSAEIHQVSLLQNNLAQIEAKLYRVSVWRIAGVGQSRREEGIRQIEEALQSTHNLISTFKASRISGIGEVQALFGNYSTRVRNAVSMLRRNAFAGASETRALDPLHTQLAAATEAFARNARQNIGQRTKYADEETAPTVQQLILISIASLTVIIVLALIIHAYVTRPIRQLAECINSLGHGTIPINVPHCNRSDEIGYLARALRRFSLALEERRKLEIQVYHQKEEALRLASDAEAASAAKSLCLANISHEIRTPMNSILGMAELLRETRLTKKQNFFATTIFNSSAALLKIINDLLDFSRIEAGMLRLDPMPFDPVRAVHDVVDLLRSAAQGKQLEILIECDPETSPCMVGDAGRIRQILTNLIGNAVKFTETGFVKISLKAKQKGNLAAVRYEINDSGIGIDKSKLNTIFDDFMQAESSTTRKFGGTGLGLSISRSLVETMGGRIGVKSQLDKGSTFWFEVELPVTDEIAPPAASEAVQAIGPSTPDALPDEPDATAAIRILVADDNDLNRLLLQNMLDRKHYNLQQAENGEIAVEMACSNTYDLILMDISMPVLDGIAATRLIREHEMKHHLKPVPIVALTAHIMPSDQKKYSDAGLSNFLAKPLRKADLQCMIEKCVRGEARLSRISA